MHDYISRLKKKLESELGFPSIVINQYLTKDGQLTKIPIDLQHMPEKFSQFKFINPKTYMIDIQFTAPGYSNDLIEWNASPIKLQYVAYNNDNLTSMWTFSRVKSFIEGKVVQTGWKQTNHFERDDFIVKQLETSFGGLIDTLSYVLNEMYRNFTGMIEIINDTTVKEFNDTIDDIESKINSLQIERDNVRKKLESYIKTQVELQKDF
jgi:hypothetical protein